MKKRVKFVERYLPVLIVIAIQLAFNGSAAQTAPGIQWQKVFGGDNDDYLRSIRPTTDGGFILGGYTSSGVSGNKTSTNYGASDYWLIKVDSGGDKVWERSYGGSGGDVLKCVQQTSDGGYILGGYSSSDVSSTKTSPLRGILDYWVVKVDAIGNQEWDKSYGRAWWNALEIVRQTTDGGYVLGGTSYSISTLDDYWVVKLDENGDMMWERTFGQTHGDSLRDIQQTSDGGYLLAGDSYQDNYGSGQDWYLVKLDADGNKVWDKYFPGGGIDMLNVLEKTSDGGFILGGFFNYGEPGVDSGPVGVFYWVMKLDGNANKVWVKYFGGGNEDRLLSIKQTSDGGYILGGASSSEPSVRKASTHFGDMDYWVVKIDANGTKIWEKSVGGESGDWLHGALQTSDGGYILAGDSYSGASGNKTISGYGQADYWIVKLGPAPAILRQPKSQTVIVGDPVTFSVLADGAEPLSYQWLFNGTNIAGATGPALTLTNTTHAQAGFYSIIVTNEWGTVTSGRAQLLFTFLILKMYAGLTIDGEIGKRYRIDYVPEFGNQIEWLTLTNVTLTTAPFLFIDVDSPKSSQRLYRAVPMP